MFIKRGILTFLIIILLSVLALALPPPPPIPSISDNSTSLTTSMQNLNTNSNDSSSQNINIIVNTNNSESTYNSTPQITPVDYTTNNCTYNNIINSSSKYGINNYETLLTYIAIIISVQLVILIFLIIYIFIKSNSSTEPQIPSQVQQYVAIAKIKGIPKTILESELRSAGYDAKTISLIMKNY